MGITMLNVVLRTAVDWGVIEQAHCTIGLLKTPKTSVPFYDFEEYERLLEAARSDALACVIGLIGGEAGLRCGEIMALGTGWSPGPGVRRRSTPRSGCSTSRARWAPGGDALVEER